MSDELHIPGWSSYKFHYPKNSGIYGTYSTHPPPLPPPSSKWLILIFLLVLGILIGASVLLSSCYAKQMQPDAKRIKQIQTALIDHNYPAGRTWFETQEILRGVARDHRWQVRYAPDARVLIILGLGNDHSDPEILDGPKNKLDGGGPDERE